MKLHPIKPTKGRTCSQAVKYKSNACVASDPDNDTPLMKHEKGLTKYSGKLKFALHLKLGKTQNFTNATETHSNASVETAGFEDGWMEESMVANKLGLLMWSPDKIRRERLADN